MSATVAATAAPNWTAARLRHATLAAPAGVPVVVLVEEADGQVFEADVVAATAASGRLVLRVRERDTPATSAGE